MHITRLNSIADFYFIISLIIHSIFQWKNVLPIHYANANTAVTLQVYQKQKTKKTTDLTASMCCTVRTDSLVAFTPFPNEPKLQRRTTRHFLPPVVNDLWKNECEGARRVEAVVHHSCTNGTLRLLKGPWLRPLHHGSLYGGFRLRPQPLDLSRACEVLSSLSMLLVFLKSSKTYEIIRLLHQCMCEAKCILVE